MDNLCSHPGQLHRKKIRLMQGEGTGRTLSNFGSSVPCQGSEQQTTSPSPSHSMIWPHPFFPVTSDRVTCTTESLQGTTNLHYQLLQGHNTPATFSPGKQKTQVTVSISSSSFCRERHLAAGCTGCMLVWQLVCARLSILHHAQGELLDQSRMTSPCHVSAAVKRMNSCTGAPIANQPNLEKLCCPAPNQHHRSAALNPGHI